MTKFNTTIGTVGDFGRFGNLFFRNICASIISKKNNIKFTYAFYEEFKQLGIDLYIDGQLSYEDENTIILIDKDFYIYIIDPNLNINSNLNFFNHNFFQTREFCFYLRDYFYNDTRKENIMSHNIRNQYLHSY
jgi:hypothetical protein